MKKVVIALLIAALVAAAVAAFLFLRKTEEGVPPITLTPPPSAGELPPEPQPVPEPPPEEPVAPTSTPPPPVVTPPHEPKEYVIRIFSNTRVEPANLTIFIGDTLTFVNEDDALHWPGADPHPTHSSLPTFDALGGISKGQSYSYTFKISGSFGYHEHLLDEAPTLGYITVLP